MDDLDRKTDEELLEIVKLGINSHVPTSQSSTAKRLLEYRKEIRELNRSKSLDEQYKVALQELNKTRIDSFNKNDQRVTEVKIFLSYSSKNKELAGNIKEWLSDFGFKVFLAHDDIEPSLQWQKVIIEKLKECHIFIPIMTPEFDISHWTDQESGIAFILDKVIIPISINGETNPHGFTAIYQALKMNPTHIATGCVRIVNILKNDSKFASFVINILLKSLETSRTYATAEYYFSLISDFKFWNKELFNHLLKITIKNNQIHYAAGVRQTLPVMIQQNMELIDSNLLQKLVNIDMDFNWLEVA